MISARSFDLVPSATPRSQQRSKQQQELIAEGYVCDMRPVDRRKKQHQSCDHCGGRFGMVTFRWWGKKFCGWPCKDA